MFILCWLLTGVVSYQWAVRNIGPPPSKYYKVLILAGPVFTIAIITTLIFDYYNE